MEVERPHKHDRGPDSELREIIIQLPLKYFTSGFEHQPEKQAPEAEANAPRTHRIPSSKSQ